MHILKRGVDLYVWRNIQLTKSRLFLFLMLFILSVMLFVMNQFPYATVGVILIPWRYGSYSYWSKWNICHRIKELWRRDRMWWRFVG